MRSRWTHVATVWLSAASLCAAGCHAEPPASDRTVAIDLARDIEALGSDDLFVSDPSLERIVAIGEPAVPVLARVYRDERPAVRVGIVEAFRQIGGPAATDALMIAARDPDTTVRYEALLVLGRIEDTRARALVESALDDPEPKIRLAAASACAAHCASPSTLARLVDLAVRDPSLATGIAARASLAEALAAEDEPRSEHAAEAIRNRAIEVMESDAPLPERTRAALLAADIGDARATPILIEAATKLDDGHVRPRAVYALGNVGGTESVQAVAASLEGPFAVYAYDALRRMAARGVREARAPLEDYAGPRPAGPLPPP